MPTTTNSSESATASQQLDVRGSILDATITSIRSNVSRVLDMYFHNVTDEFGYGAGTTPNYPATPAIITMPPTTATTATTTTTAISTDPRAARQTLVVPPLRWGGEAAATNSSGFMQSASATTQAAVTATEKVINVLGSAIRQHNSSESNSTAVHPALASASSITYPNYHVAIKSEQNCSALFANYSQTEQQQHGVFCNWTWDGFLCWPPTPAGVLARMHCPSGFHGIDTAKFANRKCELTGAWGSKPNDSLSGVGWTDYQACFKPEVKELMEKMPNFEIYLDIAKRTRTLEIVGLVLSLFALILSLIIFCNFRSLRNNRTKIHKNLFVAMVLQVIIRLTLYLDQASRRGTLEIAHNGSGPGIEDTPYLCEASYILLEYARTAMFMWMFIEGLYLHNMVTVAVFQGRFPHTIFSLLGWGMPVMMTTVWATCTVIFTNSVQDCLWNYNLTPYYWILEGPRLIVISLNFFFLMNIIRVLVVKLRQSQASDIEQTRKAVRAAIVLLPLLGITNLLHLLPDLHTPWKFALWSYVTHFLTSFQGFFIAMIYCFLNGEVRAVLLKSLAVYMSVRGHPEWAPKRASMFSGAYNTAPDTDAHLQHAGAPDHKRYRSAAGSIDRQAAMDNPSTTVSTTNTPLLSTHMNRTEVSSAAVAAMAKMPNGSAIATRTHIIDNLHNNNNRAAMAMVLRSNHYNKNVATTTTTTTTATTNSTVTPRAQHNNNNRQDDDGDDEEGQQQRMHEFSAAAAAAGSRARSGGPSRADKWMITLCFRGQKNKCVMSSNKMPPQIFAMTNLNALT